MKDNKNEKSLRDAVYQANPLVQAQKQMNTMEMRIFYLGLRGINPHLSDDVEFFDKDFGETYIPNSTLINIFGDKKYLQYIRRYCSSLAKAAIILTPEDGGVTVINLFKKLQYDPKSGLYIWFNELMRPYLLDLIDKTYTRLEAEDLFSLSSTYAIRLLELMLQYQNVPGMHKVIQRSFTVDDLRFKLNVPSKAYEGRINNFKRFVLDEPAGEINRKTKYKLTYTTIKEGRQVIRFDFALDVTEVRDAKAKLEEEGVKPPVSKKTRKKLVSSMLNAAFKSTNEKDAQNLKALPPYKPDREREEVSRLHEKQLREKNAIALGVSLSAFRDGESPVSEYMYQILKDAVKNGEQDVLMASMKSMYGLTAERFKEIYHIE